MEKKRNLWVIPTDKPSRIFITKKEGLGFDNQMLENIELDCQNQNLYITSDEEIKEGDKLLILEDNLLWGKKGEVCTFLKRQPSNHGFDKAVVESLNGFIFTAECSIEHAVDRGSVAKIILTTDQDLIKDGVQEIDDDFLEWFVNNSSCEFVLTIPDVIGLRDVFQPTGKDLYKIIIPKEDSELKCDFCKRYPRLEGTNKCESCYSVVRHFLEQDQEFKDKLLPDLREKQEKLENHYLSTPNSLVDTSRMKLDNHPDLSKQETLEEAIAKGFIKTSKEVDYTEFDWASFKLGAKWQAERMYSEEDMKQFGLYLGDNLKKSKGKTIDEIFEQFKKE